MRKDTEWWPGGEALQRGIREGWLRCECGAMPIAWTNVTENEKGAGVCENCLAVLILGGAQRWP